MAYQSLPGGMFVPIGPGVTLHPTQAPQIGQVTLDAANEACIMIGHIVTSDGASHTIDTTGSSSLQWRTGAVTFANAGTTVKVGLATVDAATGPPGRATNATNVITFDVSKSMTGGGGGVTTDAWQTHVPDAGTKTVANGDFLAFCVQMTARGGADSVLVNLPDGVSGAQARPYVTQYVAATYSATARMPNAIISFSDGALGYFHGCEVWSTVSTRTWNSGSATKEYGQLFSLPFATKVIGLYGWAATAADYDLVLYSDPLGTPVAEKTVSIDSNVVSSGAAKRVNVLFASAYTVAANAPVAAIFKPGGSNISAYYKTLNAAGHRVADPWGTSGYGVSRASGAFGNANSSLDHYYIGLIVSAFDDAAAGATGRSIMINNPSLVA